MLEAFAQKDPAGHSSSLVLRAGQYEPCPHSIGTATALVGQKLPAGQSSSALLPSGHKEPGRQSVRVTASGQYDPAGQKDSHAADIWWTGSDEPSMPRLHLYG